MPEGKFTKHAWVAFPSAGEGDLTWQAVHVDKREDVLARTIPDMGYLIWHDTYVSVQGLPWIWDLTGDRYQGVVEQGRVYTPATAPVGRVVNRRRKHHGTGPATQNLMGIQYDSEVEEAEEDWMPPVPHVTPRDAREILDRVEKRKWTGDTPSQRRAILAAQLSAGHVLGQLELASDLAHPSFEMVYLDRAELFEDPGDVSYRIPEKEEAQVARSKVHEEAQPLGSPGALDSARVDTSMKGIMSSSAGNAPNSCETVGAVSERKERASGEGESWNGGSGSTISPRAGKVASAKEERASVEIRRTLMGRRSLKTGMRQTQLQICL